MKLKFKDNPIHKKISKEHLHLVVKNYLDKIITQLVKANSNKATKLIKSQSTILATFKRSIGKRKLENKLFWGFGLHRISNGIQQRNNLSILEISANNSLDAPQSNSNSNQLHLCLFDCDNKKLKINYFTFDLLKGELKINPIESFETELLAIEDVSFLTRTRPFESSYIDLRFIGRQDIRIENPSKEIGRYYTSALKEIQVKAKENRHDQTIILPKNNIQKPRFNIFVSHSSKDKTIVNAFVNKVLQLQLGIRNNELFCTSIEGLGIRNGVDFIDKIKDKIVNSDLIILMISNSYKASEICLNEMGAAWVLGKKVITIIIPPIEYKNVGLLYGTKQIDKVNSGADLDNILMTLQGQLNLGYDGNIMRWNKHKADFLKITNKRIDSLKSKKVVADNVKGH